MVFDKEELKLQRSYIKLKMEESKIKEKIKKLEAEILESMASKGINRVNRKNTSLCVVERVYTVYSKEVKESIKKIQSDADESGSVEFKKATYLRLTQ